ncbi:MAG: orotate phosphoribosyltransferase [Acidithiobacillales bacterium SG8_45]|jgi:orotate phosphoribosyltransferase|nr:MAG: orotate phosphoribosyltransferase [Acidithiobacillales bacterium SG8_45]
MEQYQREFIDFAIDTGAIRFGEFTLKSGRKSPYFFNAGLFNTGAKLAQLGRFYAQAILDSGIEFDMLFGPAYKGIPLCTTTAIALADHHNRDVPYAFDRKEAKTHAEKGIIVGHPLEGRVLIIDDVISSGMSINAAVDIIKLAGAEPSGVIIAVDRQERGAGEVSAVMEVESTHGINVASIIKLETLVPYLSRNAEYGQHLKAIEQYSQTYGI